MFEVQDLKYATLATVSRCGMVWFSEDVLSTDMIFNNFLARIRSIPLDEGEDEARRQRKGTEDEEEVASPMLQVKKEGKMSLTQMSVKARVCGAVFSAEIKGWCSVVIFNRSSGM